MRQVIQDARSGRVDVREVPTPSVPHGGLLVRTAASVVSAGTERDMITFARKSPLAKAMDRPDLVRQVVEKARRDGVAEAYNAVTSRLDNPTPLGYSLAGVVLAAGRDAAGFAPGDRVACAGAGHAVHAEVVAVPKNLCARIPDVPGRDVIPFEEAAFATLGAIALQGVRLSAPTLGERIVVVGLGVIGQLACQLLRAHGCAVFALDRDPARVALARALGANDGGVADGSEREAIDAFTRRRGADAVLIAAATSSDEPVELAGHVSRRKGRVVVVGNVGMRIPRKSYYERELTLVVSNSYGPGRHDPEYEERGVDYPIGYVRWTEQRNMEAFLDSLSEGQLRLAPLISHRLPIERAAEAFDLIGDDPPASSMGIVLTFDSPVTTVAAMKAEALVVRTVPVAAPDGIGVGVIGAGSFARGVLLPRLGRLPGLRLRAVAASSGSSAESAARRYRFETATTAPGGVLADPAVHAVFILTPHAAHASQVLDALNAGKHVFVEKPLCVDELQLHDIAATYRSLIATTRAPVLTVGFNRRFSPLATRLRQEVQGRGPIVLSYRVNPGPMPTGHWLSDPREGGRIVGEACHFIDMAAFLTGEQPSRVFATGTPGHPEPTTIVLEFSAGSVLDLTYTHDGPQRLPKERLEVFQGGSSWLLDDWRSLEAYSGSKKKRLASGAQKKGHAEELAAFFDCVRRGDELPIPLASFLSTTMVTFSALESARTRSPVDVPPV